MKFKEVTKSGGAVSSIHIVELWDGMEEYVIDSRLFLSYKDAIKFLFLQVEEFGGRVKYRHKFASKEGQVNWREDCEEIYSCRCGWDLPLLG